MREKILAFLSVVTLGLAINACGQQQVAQPIPPTPVTSQTIQASHTPTPAPTETTQPQRHPLARVTSIVPAMTATIEPAYDCTANTVPPELLPSPSDINNDDKLIAFSTQYSSDIDWGHADVYIVRFDGSGLKQLTFEPGDDGGPTWSLDGKKIIFYSDRNHHVCSEDEIGCRMELFIINPDGTGSRKLTPDSPYYPGRSPDGKYIAYSHKFFAPLNMTINLGDYLSNIIVQNTSGSYVKIITDQLQPGSFWKILWSPTGSQFTFIGVTEPTAYFHGNSGDGYWPRHAYLANADGSNLRKLPGGPFASNEHPQAWSPDGQRLAFLTAKGIATIHADGSGYVEYPIEKSLGERDIYWLDDGQSLVFTDATGEYYKIDPDFTNLERLPLSTDIEKLIYRFRLLKTKTLWHQDGEKHLSPDGKWIAYFGCKGQIRVINAETHTNYLVLDREKEKQGMFKNSDFETSWGFGNDLAWAPDSRQLLFTYDTLYWAVNQIGRSLFVINLDGTGLRKIETGVEVWFPTVQP